MERLQEMPKSAVTREYREGRASKRFRPDAFFLGSTCPDLLVGLTFSAPIAKQARDRFAEIATDL
jgi:hypothetical protein